MTNREAAFLGLGALSFPIAYHFALRWSGRHFLSIATKEQQP